MICCLTEKTVPIYYFQITEWYSAKELSEFVFFKGLTSCLFSEAFTLRREVICKSKYTQSPYKEDDSKDDP